MPKAYERVRDSYIKSGESIDDAKKWAAMWWNRKHPDNPNPWNKEKKMMRKSRR